MSKKIVVSVEISKEANRYLEVLATSESVLGRGATVAAVLAYLAQSAADGMRRPGSWECGWLKQAFGDEWREKLQQAPGVQYAQLQPMPPPRCADCGCALDGPALDWCPECAFNCTSRNVMHPK